MHGYPPITNSAWVRYRVRPASFDKIATLANLCAEQGWRCFFCDVELRWLFSADRPESATLEHLTPLSRGGSWDRHNLAAACLACNQDKREATFEEFLRDAPHKFRCVALPGQTPHSFKQEGSRWDF